VGQVLPGQEVQIADPDKLGVGEIMVRGANVTSGYFARPDLSEQVLRDGWLYTGDLGYLDREGYLFIEGRKKDLIVTGAGKNIYPQEVASLYAELPHVAELGVVGAYSERTEGEEVHGVAVLERGEGDEQVLQEAVRSRCYEISRSLPSYHRIHRLHIWTRPLPRSDDGSVDRLALLAELEQQRQPDADPIEALPPWERAIYRHIGRITGLSPGEVAAHIDAPLDTLLDSLMAVEFVAWLEARLGIRLESIDRANNTLRNLLVQLEADLKKAEDWEEEERAPAYWTQVLHAVQSGEKFPGAGKKVIQGVLWGVGGPLFRRYFDFGVRGLEYLPQDRPYLIAANHASHLDGACVLTAVRSRVDQLNIVAAQDYFADSEFRGWFLRTFANAVPFDRHGDFAASLVAARKLVDVRRPLLVFPEGTRSESGQLQPFKTGVGLLAYELDVPVVPLHIAGTQQALPRGTHKPERHPLRLLFGEALETAPFKDRNGSLNPYEGYREIAEALKRQIEALGRKNI
jgi:long-chain acyl-CoA synthetase